MSEELVEGSALDQVASQRVPMAGLCEYGTEAPVLEGGRPV
jgi:adenylyl- and sulfurtransferase ThiI